MYYVSGVAARASKINSWVRDRRPIDGFDSSAIEDKPEQKDLKRCSDTHEMRMDVYLPHTTTLQVGGQTCSNSWHQGQQQAGKLLVQRLTATAPILGVRPPYY